MAEQLWCTWSQSGLEGKGIGRYAASEGLRSLTPNQWEDLRQFYSFPLPEGIRRATQPGDMPLSFAWDGGLDGLLVQRMYIGLDAVGRPGNYFSHMLAGLPEGFTAHEAIQRWQSPFWRSDVGNVLPGGVLAQVSAMQVTPGPLGQAAERPRALLEPLRFLIAAFLCRASDERICVIARPGTVARLIEGLTAALPAALLDGLSFSTYEAYPARSAATIVGTCPAPLVDGRVPATRFEPQFGPAQRIVIDALSQKLPDLPLSAPVRAYASFAAERLVGLADPSDLDALLELAPSWPVGRLEDLLELFGDVQRDLSGVGLTGTNLLSHLRFPKAPISLSKPRVRRAVISSALEASTTWQQHIIGELAQLSASTETASRLLPALTALAEECEEAAVEEALLGHANSASFLVDRLARAADPEAANRRIARAVERVGERVRDGASITWDVRRWAIDQAAISGAALPPKAIESFLRGSDEETLQILSLPEVPHEWHAAIITSALAGGGFRAVASIRILLLRYEEATRKALRQLLASGRGDEIARGALAAIHETQGATALTLIYEVLTAEGGRAVLVTPVLEEHLAQHDPSDPDLIRFIDHCPSVVAWCDRIPALEPILVMYLSRPLYRDGLVVARDHSLGAIASAIAVPPGLRHRAWAVRLLSWSAAARPESLELDRLAEALQAVSAVQRISVRGEPLAKLVAGTTDVATFTGLVSEFAKGFGVRQVVMRIELLGGYMQHARTVSPELLVSTLPLLAIAPRLQQQPRWKDVSDRLQQYLINGRLFPPLVSAWVPTSEPVLWTIFTTLLAIYVRDVHPLDSQLVEQAMGMFRQAPKGVPESVGLETLRDVARLLSGAIADAATLRRLLDLIAPDWHLSRGEILALLLRGCLDHVTPPSQAALEEAVALVMELSPEQRRRFWQSEPISRYVSPRSLEGSLTSPVLVLRLASSLADTCDIPRGDLLLRCLRAQLDSTWGPSAEIVESVLSQVTEMSSESLNTLSDQDLQTLAALLRTGEMVRNLIKICAKRRPDNGSGAIVQKLLGLYLKGAPGTVTPPAAEVLHAFESEVAPFHEAGDVQRRVHQALRDLET